MRSLPSRIAMVVATTVLKPAAVCVSLAGKGPTARNQNAQISAKIKAVVWMGSASVLRALGERTVELSCVLWIVVNMANALMALAYVWKVTWVRTAP